MALLDFGGDYGSDVRPPRAAGDGRKLWAKDPSGEAATDGTRLDATLLNDLVALIRATLSAFSVVASPGDDNALATSITAAIATTVEGLALDDLAPKDSPELTGTPTAPTATVGDTSTAIATTAFVAAAVAALVNSAPGTLDTLKELADALGDDPNFATTITTALGLKAPLASPALTGNPTAPTQAAGDNSTNIATTAFVAALGALKANLDSPALTGAPTAPTASPGTNTTQLATTAFAAALGALKANLASPTFTGTPAAPTAVAGTNTTQLATTAFVAAAIAALSTGVVSVAGLTGVVTAVALKSALSLVKADVGLDNVDNTSDVGKPVSTAQQTALNAKMSAPDVIIEDQKTSGTAGGTFTSGARRVRDLNTLVRNAASLASLSSNQFTLPAGTYFIMLEAPAHACDQNQAWLRNATDGSDAFRTHSNFSSSGNIMTHIAFGSGVVTIAGSKTFQIEHQCTATRSSNGFGPSASFGVEVYTRVLIWKLS